MRSLFTFFLSEGNRHAHFCAVSGKIDFKSPADQLYSLLHAGDANSNFDRGHVFPSRSISKGPMAEVADFQRKICVAINSYFGFLTSRVELDVGETLLYNSKDSELDISCHPSETR